MEVRVGVIGQLIKCINIYTLSLGDVLTSDVILLIIIFKLDVQSEMKIATLMVSWKMMEQAKCNHLSEILLEKNL